MNSSSKSPKPNSTSCAPSFGSRWRTSTRWPCRCLWNLGSGRTGEIWSSLMWHGRLARVPISPLSDERRFLTYIPCMFIGHFAVGFGAKKFAPRASLAALIAAPLFLDILWPPFLLLGWEHVRIDPGNTRYTPLDLYDYPWSHSLVMSIVWATAFALIYHLITHYPSGTIAIWIGVVSHWVLDWVTHRPDMPLCPGGGPKLGLGLWNSVPGTMMVELSMFAVGILFYMQTTRARDWASTRSGSPVSARALPVGAGCRSFCGRGEVVAPLWHLV